MYKFDRTKFENFKAEDRKSDYAYWSERSLQERLETAFYLISVAYNLDPQSFPRMDKGVFESRKRM